MGSSISNSSNSSSNSSDSSNNSINDISNSSNNSISNISNSLDNTPGKGYKSHQELLNSSWYGKTKTELDNLINSLGDETIFLNRYIALKEVYDDENLQPIAKDLQEINDLQENNFTPSKEEGRNLINGLLQHRRESDKFNVYLFISKLADGRSDSPYLRF
ncbi:15049_t:CDS:2 [Gigaspora rosea]|nr:15049_t:CDS:2 [Gigaspora rosea]